MSHIKGRTLSLTLGGLLALSGCVIHVHEKGEAEASTSSSSGGEGSSSNTTTQPAAGHGQTAHHDTHEHPHVDKPATHEVQKPATPVVDNSKPVKPVTGSDKPKTPVVKPVPVVTPVAGSDKPQTPAAGKDDKPAAGGSAQPGKGDGKPTIVHDKPVIGDHKPIIIVEKPVHHDPQRTEPDATDKTTSMHDRPVSYDGKDEKKPSHLPLNDATKDAIRQNGTKPATGVSSATDPHKVAPVATPEKAAGAKPAVTAAKDPFKGHLDKGAVAGLGADAGRTCKLFSPAAAPGEKVRLRVTGVDAGANVELEGKPLKVLKRDENAWVVQLENDAKTGRLSLKHGELTVACGKLQVK